LRAEALEEERR